MFLALLALTFGLDIVVAPPPKKAPPFLAELRRLAKNAQNHPTSPWVRAFLDAAAHLPEVPPAIVDTYYGRIADPLGYLRPLEVLAKAGYEPAATKLLDFGYGNIGQLKMLADLGAHAVGIEVDPQLPKLYAKENGKSGLGSIRILHGFFPKDARLVAEVGTGYHVFLSKNTLKRGYVHPQVPGAAKDRIDLGDDAAFLKAVHALLRPGGWFFVYNFGPAPAKPGKPYVPMADIGLPFSRAQLEQAGFEVVAFDADDSKEGRVVAKLLEWDQGEGAMDVERGLFAKYTLARRR